MKNKKHLLIIFGFFTLFTLFINTSLFVFAGTKTSFSCANVFLDKESYAKKHIQKQIRELRGGEAFSEKYKFAQGLLALTDELHGSKKFPESTDFIRTIYQVVSNSNILRRDHFRSLKWVPFPGFRDELAALMHGFFDKGNLIRKGENGESVFFLDEKKWIPIESEGGFHLFVRRVFKEQKSTASLYAVAVLTEDHLKELGWESLLFLRNFLEDSRYDLLFEMIEENRTLRNQKAGQFKNEKGKVVEELMIKDAFEHFKHFFQLKEEGFNISVRGIKINETVSFPLETLQGTELQDNPFFKADDKGKVRRKFDVVIPALKEGPDASKKRSFIIVEIKNKLILENVNEFLENLKAIDLFFSESHQHIFFGAFAFIDANQDAVAKANSEGLYLLRLKPEFKGENFGTFKATEFPQKSINLL